MAKKTNEPKPPYRNYEANQEKIRAAYVKLGAEGVILPSYEVIAKEAKVSLSTVKRHFGSLNFDYICKRERIHTPAVIDAIRKSALDGKARAQKLYAQIMEGYIEKKEQKTDIVGDLNINADISGELKVNIQRGIIKSREDLESLQNVVNAVKKSDLGQEKIDETLDVIKKIVPEVTQDIDKLILFK